MNYNSNLLVKILQILKANGKLVIYKYLEQKDGEIEFELKMNGFINITVANEIVCNKPSYEIGSFTKIDISKKAIPSVWKLDDTIDEDIETIDPDNLLEDDDLIKPDPASLKGTICLKLPLPFLMFCFSMWYNWQTKGLQKLYMWID